MLKQKLVAIFTVLFIFFTGMPVALPAYAASGATNSNFFSGLVQFISQKLGLDQNKVQSVVTEYKNQNKPNMQQNMQDREKARLDALVKAGKITSAQETLIINELTALRSKYNPANFKDLTADQRKQQIQNEQNDIKAWLQGDGKGIDPSYVMPFGGGANGGMRGKGPGKFGNRPSPTPTP